MSRKIFVAIAAVATLFATATAAALPQEGDQEIELSGGFFRQIGSGSGTFNADVGYGSFISDQIELGIRQSFNYTIADEGPDVWIASTVPFLEYHFASISGYGQGLVPFIGGVVGIVWNEEDLTGTVGPTGGFKMFMNESTYLVARYRYEWLFDELEESDVATDSSHILNVGLGYQW